jgi:hypothetical protein
MVMHCKKRRNKAGQTNEESVECSLFSGALLSPMNGTSSQFLVIYLLWAVPTLLPATIDTDRG